MNYDLHTKEFMKASNDRLQSAAWRLEQRKAAAEQLVKDEVEEEEPPLESKYPLPDGKESKGLAAEVIRAEVLDFLLSTFKKNLLFSSS